MRGVVQRVERAAVHVAEETVASIEAGLLVLVGVARDDTEADALQLADKLVHLRVFPDAEGKMNLSLREASGSLCLVSQFTLLGDARRGRRPSYIEAAPPEQAEPLFEQVVGAARAQGVPVVTGRFRTHMHVDLVNDGPVTLLLDTRRLF